MSENNEPEVTLEGIDAALDSLIKAADATEMAKAYGGTAVDSYGHVDERGKTSGGYADKGDMGGLDSMMIGKMEQSLIEQGFPAAAIAAFMRGKQSDDEEDDDEMEGKMGKPASTAGGVGTNPRVSASGGGSTMAKMGDDDEDYGKSFDAFREDPAIGDAIDVSDFLGALVQRTTEQLDALGKSQAAMSAEQRDVNAKMATAMFGIGQLVKGLAAHANRLDQRLGLVERQPNAPRGATNVPRARAMAKSFGAHGAEGGGTELSKSQVIATLSYMNLEKGMREIGGRATSELIGLYEGGNQLAPQAFHAVQRFLATHPNEAQVAVNYR